MNRPLQTHLTALHLPWIRENIDTEVAEAARKNRSHHELVERLIEGEYESRRSRAVERSIREAKLPKRSTLASYDFHFPREINADHVRHLFSLAFMATQSNVVFIGTVGTGKTHLATALALQACESRKRVRFVSAAVMINELWQAERLHDLQAALKRYLQPELLVIDELGYLPVDKLGAELLFQVLAGRYEKASTVITTNRAYRDWGKTFADDNAMTAAVLDRVTHHCETIVIIGDSYRSRKPCTQ